VATIPLLINLIGIEEYGLWALASAIVGVLGLMEGGLSVSTTVFASRDRAGGRPEAMAETLSITGGAMLCLATAAALLLWTGSEWIASFFDKLSPAQRAAAATAIKYSSVVVWMRFLQQVLVGIEQAFERYGIINIVSSAQQMAGNLGLLAVAFYGGRVAAFMQWTALVGAVALGVHALIVRRLMGPGLRPRPWRKERVLEIMRYSGMAWVTTLGSALFAQCDRLIIGRLLGSELLGIYAAVSGVALQINSLSGLSAQPLVPFVASAKEAGRLRQPEVRERIREAFELNAVIALGLGLGLFLATPWIIQILIPSHPEAQPFFMFSATVYSLYSINGTGYHLLHGLRAMRECMVIQLLSGTLALLLVALGAYMGGLMGAVAGCTGYLGVWLLTVAAARHLELPFRVWREWLRPYLLVFAPCLLAAYWLPATLPIRVILTAFGLGWLGFIFFRRHRAYLSVWFGKFSKP